MTHIKNDANILLILLAGILLLAFIGFGIFFQMYIADVSQDHQQTIENLNTLRAELEDEVNRNTNLNLTLMNLTSKYAGQREEISDALALIEEEKQVLSSELNVTERELALTKSSLTLSQTKLTNAQTALSLAQTQIINLTTIQEELQSDIVAIERDIGRAIGDINGYLEDNETTSSSFKSVRNRLEDIHELCSCTAAHSPVGSCIFCQDFLFEHDAKALQFTKEC